MVAAQKKAAETMEFTDVVIEVLDKSSPLSLQTVVAAVKQAQSGSSNSAVVISADRNIKYESVVKLMDTLQRAGIARVGLSVQLANY